MPVLDPSACAPGLRTAIWRAYCGVASSVNTKQTGCVAFHEEKEKRMRVHTKNVHQPWPIPRHRLGHLR